MRTSLVGILVGSAALILSFQNCAQTGFSQEAAQGASVVSTSSSSSSSSAPGSGQISQSANSCITYAMQGNPNMNSSYYFVSVPAGTQINQEVGCNGRPSSVGFQPSYCNGALAECHACQSALSQTTCGSDGVWHVGPAIVSTTSSSSPSHESCNPKHD